MGRTTDELGDDHEGYCEAELERPVPIYAEDRWTATGCAETDAAGPTGRHRAACSCGWRGPVSALDVKDVFLPDHLYDHVLGEWEFHIAPLLGLAALRDAAAVIADAQRRVTALVGEARDAGRSWSEIAAALGVSKQAAQQRYGTLERAL